MTLRSQKVLITGATGFLGQYLVKRFHHEGARVIAASRTAASKANLFPSGVRPVDMDITDPDTLFPALEGAEIIIHAAAKVGDWGRPQTFVESIRNGTENLLNALNREKLKQFIYISSVSVYGIDRAGVMTEDLTADVLSWPYAAAKAAAEKVVMGFYSNYNIPVTIIRPANVFGPGSEHWTDRPAEIIRKGMMNLPSGFGKSNTVFVENVVEGIRCACNHPAAIGESFNISDEYLVGWDEFFLNYAAVFGKDKIVVLPVWLMKAMAVLLESISRLTDKPPLITRTAIDFLRFKGTYSIEKAQKQLGYQPLFGREKAFKITREYLKEKYGRQSESPV
ncbi:MAG: NAD-dependent epimerase/dehydratase family protein [Deltaproteobacteria bacterium]|nr:NAD-dependent epimerase/dehydratase family protein [Deltaproteobacteria bacterium]